MIGCSGQVRKLLFTLLVTVTFVGSAHAMDMGPQAIRVGRGERLLVIAPHPDDETLGAGGLIQRVLAAGGSARVVLMTAGDGYREGVVSETGRQQPQPSEYVEYGERRYHEARAAVRELGGDRVRLELLGYPDRGLDALLGPNWQRIHVERSATTGASDPPYRQALDPDIPYAGANVRAQLVRLLRETRPTIVAFPDPIDKHPDHRATAIFTLLAIDEWSREGKGMPPRLLGYLVHWPGWPPGWDGGVGAGTTRDALLLPATLPARDLGQVALQLSPTEVSRKTAALARHESQEEVMRPFLGAFLRQTEPFTVFTIGEARRMAHSAERLRQAQEHAKTAAKRG